MRKTLGKKLRFEVFKRDSFTCQYCGKKAPDVVLHADHIQPVCDGGEDDLLNLVTSCEGCNLGKGARLLSDNASIEQKHSQLAILQEKREQLEMMVEWQTGLMNLDRDQVDAIEGFWREVCGSGLNEYARGEIKKWLRKFPVDEVMVAIREAAESKLCFDGDLVLGESVTQAFHLVPKILHLKKQAEKEPYLRDALYIRGILRRRFEGEVVDWQAKDLLLQALNAGSSVETEKDWAIKAGSLGWWKTEMERSIRELQAENREE